MTRRKERFDGTLEEFIDEQEKSIQLIINYFNEWSAQFDELEPTYSLSYESLHENTSKELSQIAEFLELPNVDQEQIDRCVEYAEFENMRKMEKKNKFDSGVLQSGDSNDPNSYKTRKGKTRSYGEEIPAEFIDNLEQKISSELSPFYERYCDTI
jgi:hypothetical protein